MQTAFAPDIRRAAGQADNRLADVGSLSTDRHMQPPEALERQ